MSITQPTSPSVSHITIGIYAAPLKCEPREKVPLFGLQRLMSWGNGCGVPIAAVRA
jgi:hypothetical protein